MRSFLFGLVAASAVTASPVTKVVELIKELQAKVIADGESEQKIYNKFACWCEKTTDRKAKAIETAKSDIARLGNEVLSLKGKVATLASEIAKLQKEIKINEEDQAKSTSIRQKENTDFQQEKAEIEQTLNALERALKVLSGAGTAAASLLQTQEKATIEAALRIADVNSKNTSLIKMFLKQGYAPQSASIQGILKDMYTTFATNLEEDTQTEFEKQTAFEKKIALLQEELATMQATVAKKSAQKADTEVTLADTTQTLEDTTNQMNDDADFFDQTKKNCKAKSDEWSERTRLRTEELDGIKLALKVLTSDEARALFDKAIKPGMETGARSFIQVDSNKNRIFSAIKAIQKTAAKAHSIKLAALAVELRKSGHFDKVIKAIDDMIQTLAEEETDDKEKRDECKEKTHVKTEEKLTLEHKIERNGIKIDKLTAKKEKLEAEIEATSEAIQQTKDDIKQMTEDREAEHAAFLQAKEDDENAIKLLAQAIGHLSSYLDANKVEMGPLQNLMQEPEFEVSEDQAPEAGFAGKDDNKQESKGIVSILTMLKTDLEDEVTNGVKADEASEKMFQENKTAAETLLAQLRDKRTNLKSEKADTEGAIADTEELKKTNEGKLEAKEEELATIKPGCDWMFENFEKRREFRMAEREGLAQAKAILSGMKTGSLLAKKATVTKHAFNDHAFSNAVKGFLQRK